VASEIAMNQSTTPPPAVAEALAPFETKERFGPGRTLFREGEEPLGVYFLHEGEVDLVFASRLGNSKPLRVASPGQILGLSCVVSNKPHDCSATSRSNATVGFIDKDRFTALLQERPALWLTVLQTISSDIAACWDCMRALKC
jgi:CRP-like cAMP-binding protein